MYKVLSIEAEQTKFIVNSFEEYYELIKLLKPSDCALSMHKIACIRVKAEIMVQLIAEDTIKFTWYGQEE